MMAALRHWRGTWRAWLPLAGLVLLALALRLAVWRWREFYELGGDEREYLDQALRLLQQRQYSELRLMRPPVYTFFLAGSILLVDSLVQNLRLVQAVISALTVVPLWLLVESIDDRYWTTRDDAESPSPISYRSSVVACLLLALSYTLAANATELLSETIFLFGLTTVFWLLVRTARSIRVRAETTWRWAAAAGLALGLLCLVRSVALPLVPLGALWLALQMNESREPRTADREVATERRRGFLTLSSRFWYALILVLCALIMIAPWTARNYLTYGALIVIDTTGAENLWLDNNPQASTPDDPLGREDAKRQLYALGDDRAARQRLASQRGLAAISTNPDWFATKAWGELLKLFALEYSDDMRARPAIWHPSAEVWARLLLGDGLWLVVLLGGVAGLALAQAPDARQHREAVDLASRVSRLISRGSGPRSLFIPWLLYIVLTAMVFHVELRYRLPVYPVLIPYAALLLVSPRRLRWHPVAVGGAAAAVAICCALTLLHAPYPALARQLGAKHYHLWQAERALAAGDAARAEAEGRAAAALDETSALAHVALARAALLRSDHSAALADLQGAISRNKAHPYAHLLLGDLLRSTGQQTTARPELAYESRSLEDLQSWSWDRMITPPAARLAIGDGLDLGFVAGMYPAEQGGWRWTQGRSRLRLHASTGGTTLRLRLASGRPAAAPPLHVRVLVAGRTLGTLTISQGWTIYDLPLPAATSGDDQEVVLIADTLTPRDYERSSPDGRALGVMIDWAEIGP